MLLLVLFAGGLAHGQHIRNSFQYHHWEDWRFFRHNRANIHSPVDCFTKPSAWPGLYRPLSTNCYYLAGRTLFANRVEVYHLVNIATFTANALLLFSIARTLLPAGWAFLPPVLWASRLAHFQVLIYTSEFQVLLSTLFGLAGLRLWITSAEERRLGRAAGALAFFALALLSKESAVCLPAIVAAYGWLYERGWPRWRDVAWLAAALLWAVLFAVLFRRVNPEPSGYGYDVSWAVLPRLAAYFLTFWNPLVYPIDDSEMVSRIALWVSRPAVVVATAVAMAGLVVLLVAARRGASALAASPWRTVAFGLAWFVAGTAPFLLFEDRLFMRYGYFPHAGLALAAAGALAGGWPLVRGLRVPVGRRR